GDYHHHGAPTCLIAELNDSGDGHSEIYGFAADGYPIYGPWQADGVLAESCWIPRDYDDPDSPTGCGVAGERSCLLVDPYDISQGTTPASSNGPRTDEVVTSLSGNTFVATSGYYFEDYYYDPACTAQGGEHLDQYNGHDHDGLGYHYHVTVEQTASGGFVDDFPYYIGPEMAGQLQPDGILTCGGGQTPGGPPGEGGSQDDEPDLSPVAEALGVELQALLDAIGQPPPDFGAVAAELGLSEEAVRQAFQDAGLGGP
ncbi:MAG: YHYH protein, partial [Chloroflexota bacterium]